MDIISMTASGLGMEVIIYKERRQYEFNFIVSKNAEWSCMLLAKEEVFVLFCVGFNGIIEWTHYS